MICIVLFVAFLAGEDKVAFASVEAVMQQIYKISRIRDKDRSDQSLSQYQEYGGAWRGQGLLSPQVLWQVMPASFNSTTFISGFSNFFFPSIIV